MKALTRISLALTVVLWIVVSSAADDWLAFRGTKNNGYSPDKNTPVKWTGAENVAWKFKLPGPGSSSPIVVGDKVFVTCYTGTPADKLVRHLICLDRAKGTPVWQKDLPAQLPETPYKTGAKDFISEHGYASSTPVSDGTHVFVFFGRSGVYAFDLKGQQLWHKDVGEKLHELGWGSASSPVLYKGLLIVNANIESNSLIAFDKKTGNEVWRKPVGDNSWTTPVLVDAPGGKAELVVSMPEVVKGIDPATGDALWQCKGIPKFTTSSPVTRDGMAYVTGGGGPYPGMGFAVKAGGRGDVSKDLLWKNGASSGITSPVVTDKYLFAVDRGKLTCFSRDKGQAVVSRPMKLDWKEYSSPTVADGKVYFVNRAGTTYVFSADDKMTPLGENLIEEEEPRFDGSPVVSDGQLLLRSTHYLYCVGKK